MSDLGSTRKPKPTPRASQSMDVLPRSMWCAERAPRISPHAKRSKRRLHKQLHVTAERSKSAGHVPLNKRDAELLERINAAKRKGRERAKAKAKAKARAKAVMAARGSPPRDRSAPRSPAASFRLDGPTGLAYTARAMSHAASSNDRPPPVGAHLPKKRRRPARVHATRPPPESDPHALAREAQLRSSLRLSHQAADARSAALAQRGWHASPRKSRQAQSRIALDVKDVALGSPSILSASKSAKQRRRHTREAAARAHARAHIQEDSRPALDLGLASPPHPSTARSASNSPKTHKQDSSPRRSPRRSPSPLVEPERTALVVDVPDTRISLTSPTPAPRSAAGNAFAFDRVGSGLSRSVTVHGPHGSRARSGSMAPVPNTLAPPPHDASDVMPVVSEARAHAGRARATSVSVAKLKRTMRPRAAFEQMLTFQKIGTSLENIAGLEGDQKTSSVLAASSAAARRGPKRSRPRSVNINALSEPHTGSASSLVPDLWQDLLTHPPVTTDFSTVLGIETAKSGTLARLIEYLVVHEDDTVFEAMFLLNYRVMLSRSSLFAHLRTLFLASPEQACLLGPSGSLTTHDLTRRILDIVGTWVSCYYFDDFAGDPAMIKALGLFLSKEAPAAGLAEEATMLRELRDSLSLEVHAEHLWPEEAPEPHVPERVALTTADANRDLTWYEVKDVELARQLTLIESAMFHEIRPAELVDAPWMSEKTSLDAANVVAFIAFFNKLYLWATLEVIKPFTKAERARAYAKMVRLIGELYKIRNYNATMALVGALNSAPVLRLSHTLKLVGSKSRKSLRRIEDAMSTERNYQKYRAVLAETRDACIPYLWLTLHDLVLAKDGNRLHPRSDSPLDIYSMARSSITHTIIADLIRLQSHDYNFVPLPAVQSLFADLKLMDEDAMYKVSNNREPRGADGKDLP